MTMKGKDLIKLIQDNNLEDFEISVIFTDGYNVFPNVKSLELQGLADVGHSSKVAYLDGELDDWPAKQKEWSEKMIENEAELKISKESLTQFSSALENIDKDDYFQSLSSRKREIYKQALIGEVDTLKGQVKKLESLKR